ncbi:MAG: SHOCT domain-containing protein [Oscillospiraceae bacterium]|nr:SHOCT domain-containing protein [Oscillospiraceae bacterium]
MMTKIESKSDNLSLGNIVSTAVQIPGVKVSRDAFLCETFKDADTERLRLILEKGPVEAGCIREELKKKAARLIKERTLLSSGASFVAGLPGGLAMAATIPADVLQVYGVALRLAQELSYLYGEGDLWNDGMLDKERVTNQLILYCGVMLGASGAAQTVRVLSSSLAKQALKKLPQQALTKTFYYPIIKSIAKAFGARMTKQVFAKGVSKAVPIIGGVVSGGITLASMLPMGQRLAAALEDANYTYSEKSFEADWKDIVETIEEVNAEDSFEVETDSTVESTSEVSPMADVIPAVENDSSIFTDTEQTPKTAQSLGTPALDKIRQAKEMLDAGVITEQEFAVIKTKLIADM